MHWPYNIGSSTEYLYGVEGGHHRIPTGNVLLGVSCRTDVGHLPLVQSRPTRTWLRLLARRVRWRDWIGRCVIAALVLPSLGPLPWLLFGAPVEAGAAATHQPHVHDHSSAPHDHGSPSDAPGSPTHPADHDCLACQVLAQLGRCCSLPVPTAPAPQHYPVTGAVALPEAPARLDAPFALTPPARAPPRRAGSDT